MNPARLAKTVRRLVVPVMIVAVIVLWMCFGSMRVQAGMDTLTGIELAGRRMPPVPAGSLCIVDKRQSAVSEGAAVFVELEDRSVLLSRVVAVTEDGLVLRNDNRASRLPDSGVLGTVPLTALRGTVMVVFPPEGADGR